MKRITYNVPMDKKLRIEQLAIEASQRTGKTIKWTDIMEILTTEFAKDAQQMIIHLNKKTKES